jgi:all-trans-retinol 13,14-reductase
MGDLGGPYDAVVIGSGMSGLAAGNILAREGLKVLLLEQHYVFGGYLQRFWISGTPFDTGCHYVGALGEGQVFDRYLRYLGVRDDIVARPMDPDGFDELIFPGFRFAIPAGYERFEARLVEHFPDERDGIRAYLREIRAEVARFPMYSLAPAPAAAAAALPQDRTVADVLSAVRAPLLREILCAYNVLYLVPPEEAPFTLHAFVTDSYLMGAYSIDGGGHALAQALLRRFRERGGVARRKRRVVAIDVEGGEVRGIRTQRGEVESCRTVVACIDPKVAVALLPPGAVRPVFRHRIERLRPGLGGVAAYLRTSADLSAYRNNYFVYGDGGNAEIFTERWLHERAPAPVWLTSHSAREPGWKGSHALVALSALRAEHFAAWEHTTTGARGPEYEAFKRDVGERLVASARRFIPELEGRIESVEYATPLTHRDYTLNSGGAMYGTHHSVSQSGPRGASWRTRVRGLLLGGHSVLYPGLLGATVSAFYTCGEIFGIDALRKRLAA